MYDDATRWDEKYRQRKHTGLPRPDPLLVQYLELFHAQHRVVDLASGRGRHALLLAARGCFVIALDCSRVALEQCRCEANSQGLTVHPIVADLTDYRFPPKSLDAIICFNYLNRELSENICESLKPGGYLLLKTFNRNYLRTNPHFNPKYVLTTGELQTLFGGMEMIWLHDDCSDQSQTSSAIVAIRR